MTLLRDCLTTAGWLALALPAAAAEPWRTCPGADNCSGLAFSPDGQTAWWAQWDGTWGSSERGRSTIVSATLDAGRWSDPVPAPFAGGFSDDDPFVSPDGNWLYFISDRPVDRHDDIADANIWRMRLDDRHDLEYLSVNSPATEYSPAVTSSGIIFFASDRDGGPGRGDIYRAEPSDGGFLEPEPLGDAVNSPFGEWNVWVSPTGDELIFEASSRPTNVSVPGDLYYSRRCGPGWTQAVPLERLNSSGSDLLPRMHPDGKALSYTTAPIGGHARIVTVDWLNPNAPDEHLIDNTD